MSFLQKVQASNWKKCPVCNSENIEESGDDSTAATPDYVSVGWKCRDCTSDWDITYVANDITGIMKRTVDASGYSKNIK